MAPADEHSSKATRRPLGRGGRAAPQPASGGVHVAEWLSELVGTALLIFGGLGAVTLDFSTGSPVATLIPSVSVRLLITGLLFAGTGSLVAISPLGRRSGAHLNPSVTIGFWVLGKVHPHDLFGYIAGQVTGAFIAELALRALWPAPLASLHGAVTQPGPGVTELQALGIEAMMTAVLVATIFAFVSSPRTARWTPLAVWIVVAALVWQGAPFTGTSLNAARSLAPAVVYGEFHALWVYLLGPAAGAAALALAWRSMARERPVLTAKLFHDPHYPSVLHSLLPALGPVAWQTETEHEEHGARRDAASQQTEKDVGVSDVTKQ